MTRSSGKHILELPDWEQRYREGTPPWDTGRPSAELMRIVQGHLLPPGPTLELGCGTGANAVWLSRQRSEVTAIDWSPLAIERARLRCEEQGGLVRFVYANVFDFAKTAGRFQFVFDVGFYHFIRQAERERFLDMLWWVTEPGSFYFTLAGNAEEQEEDGPPRVSEAEIRTELGRLFEFVELRPCRLESSRRAPGYLGWSCLMRRPILGQ